MRDDREAMQRLRSLFERLPEGDPRIEPVRRRARTRMVRRIVATVVVAVVVAAGVVVPIIFLSPIGGGRQVAGAPDAGLGLQVPNGWDVRTTYLEGTPGPTLEAASFTLPSPGPDAMNLATGSMAPGDIALAIRDNTDACPCSGFESSSLPIQISSQDYTKWPGLNPGHSFAERSVEVGGRWLNLWIDFAESPVSDGSLGEVNRVLSTLSLRGSVSSEVATDALLPPVFFASTGWNVVSTGPVPIGSEAPLSAWASNVPFEASDLQDSARSGQLVFLPTATMKRLPADGIVVVASLALPGEFPAPRGDVFADRNLPLTLADADVRRGWEGQVALNIPEYVIWARVGEQAVDLRVYFGTLDPGPETLRAANEELSRLVLPATPTGPYETPAEATPTPTTSPDVVYFPPFLQGGSRWYTRSSNPAPGGDATVAWASTMVLKDDPAVRGTPAIPIDTISALPPEGIVITVLSTPWSLDPYDGPFPYADMKLSLTTAGLRGPDTEEPPGEYAVIEIEAPPVLVRVYFGTPSPSQQLIDMAQRELDTLQLPPVCPAPGSGGYGAALSMASGAAGDVVRISGPMPFRFEDGSYDSGGDGFVTAWWNADPKDWPFLSSFSTTQPSPAVDGSRIIRLGEGGRGACSFSISFTVPDVAPGEYPIVVLNEDPNSSTLEASLVFDVTMAGE